MMGMKVPPAIVGGIAAQSPAQEAVTVDGKSAPLRVGDRILRINGTIQHDFTKIGLNTALARAGEPASAVEGHLHLERLDAKVDGDYVRDGLLVLDDQDAIRHCPLRSLGPPATDPPLQAAGS